MSDQFISSWGTTVHADTHGTMNTSAEVLPLNARRIYLLIKNDSDTVIYLGLGVAAVANKGIRLDANGGTYEMKIDQNLWQGAINSLCATAATKRLTIQEGLRAV